MAKSYVCGAMWLAVSVQMLIGVLAYEDVSTPLADLPSRNLSSESAFQAYLEASLVLGENEKKVYNVALQTLQHQSLSDLFYGLEAAGVTAEISLKQDGIYISDVGKDCTELDQTDALPEPVDTGFVLLKHTDATDPSNTSRTLLFCDSNAAAVCAYTLATTVPAPYVNAIDRAFTDYSQCMVENKIIGDATAFSGAAKTLAAKDKAEEFNATFWMKGMSELAPDREVTYKSIDGGVTGVLTLVIDTPDDPLIRAVKQLFRNMTKMVIDDAAANRDKNKAIIDEEAAKGGISPFSFIFVNDLAGISKARYIDSYKSFGKFVATYSRVVRFAGVAMLDPSAAEKGFAYVTKGKAGDTGCDSSIFGGDQSSLMGEYQSAFGYSMGKDGDKTMITVTGGDHTVGTDLEKPDQNGHVALACNFNVNERTSSGLFSDLMRETPAAVTEKINMVIDDVVDSAAFIVTKLDRIGSIMAAAELVTMKKDMKFIGIIISYDSNVLWPQLPEQLVTSVAAATILNAKPTEDAYISSDYLGFAQFVTDASHLFSPSVGMKFVGTEFCAENSFSNKMHIEGVETTSTSFRIAADGIDDVPITTYLQDARSLVCRAPFAAKALIASVDKFLNEDGNHIFDAEVPINSNGSIWIHLKDILVPKTKLFLVEQRYKGFYQLELNVAKGAAIVGLEGLTSIFGKYTDVHVTTSAFFNLALTVYVSQYAKASLTKQADGDEQKVEIQSIRDKDYMPFTDDYLRGDRGTTMAGFNVETTSDILKPTVYSASVTPENSVQNPANMSSEDRNVLLALLGIQKAVEDSVLKRVTQVSACLLSTEARVNFPAEICTNVATFDKIKSGYASLNAIDFENTSHFDNAKMTIKVLESPKHAWSFDFTDININLRKEYYAVYNISYGLSSDASSITPDIFQWDRLLAVKSFHQAANVLRNTFFQFSILSSDSVAPRYAVNKACIFNPDLDSGCMIESGTAGYILSVTDNSVEVKVGEFGEDISDLTGTVKINQEIPKPELPDEQMKLVHSIHASYAVRATNPNYTELDVDTFYAFVSDISGASAQSKTFRLVETNGLRSVEAKVTGTGTLSASTQTDHPLSLYRSLYKAAYLYDMTGAAFASPENGVELLLRPDQNDTGKKNRISKLIPFINSVAYTTFAYLGFNKTVGLYAAHTDPTIDNLESCAAPENKLFVQANAEQQDDENPDNAKLLIAIENMDSLDETALHDACLAAIPATTSPNVEGHLLGILGAIGSFKKDLEEKNVTFAVPKFQFMPGPVMLKSGNILQPFYNKSGYDFAAASNYQVGMSFDFNGTGFRASTYRASITTNNRIQVQDLGLSYSRVSHKIVKDFTKFGEIKHRMLGGVGKSALDLLARVVVLPAYSRTVKDELTLPLFINYAQILAPETATAFGDANGFVLEVDDLSVKATACRNGLCNEVVDGPAKVVTLDNPAIKAAFTTTFEDLLEDDRTVANSVENLKTVMQMETSGIFEGYMQLIYPVLKEYSEATYKLAISSDNDYTFTEISPVVSTGMQAVLLSTAMARRIVSESEAASPTRRLREARQLQDGYTDQQFLVALPAFFTFLLDFADAFILIPSPHSNAGTNYILKFDQFGMDTIPGTDQIEIPPGQSVLQFKPVTKIVPTAQTGEQGKLSVTYEFKWGPLSTDEAVKVELNRSVAGNRDMAYATNNIGHYQKGVLSVGAESINLDALLPKLVLTKHFEKVKDQKVIITSVTPINEMRAQGNSNKHYRHLGCTYSLSAFTDESITVAITDCQNSRIAQLSITQLLSVQALLSGFRHSEDHKDNNALCDNAAFRKFERRMYYDGNTFGNKISLSTDVANGFQVGFGTLDGIMETSYGQNFRSFGNTAAYVLLYKFDGNTMNVTSLTPGAADLDKVPTVESDNKYFGLVSASGVGSLGVSLMKDMIDLYHGSFRLAAKKTLNVTSAAYLVEVAASQDKFIRSFQLRLSATVTEQQPSPFIHILSDLTSDFTSGVLVPKASLLLAICITLASIVFAGAVSA